MWRPLFIIQLRLGFSIINQPFLRGIPQQIGAWMRLLPVIVFFLVRFMLGGLAAGRVGERKTGRLYASFYLGDHPRES
jgi:hypothetical protein